MVLLGYSRVLIFASAGSSNAAVGPAATIFVFFNKTAASFMTLEACTSTSLEALIRVYS